MRHRSPAISQPSVCNFVYREKGKVEAAFWWMLSSASDADLAWLFGRYEQMYARIYVLNSPGNKAHHPSCEELPWPVALYFGTRSKKHIELERLVPSTSLLNRVFLQAEQSMMWKDTFTSRPKEWWKFEWGRRHYGQFKGTCLPETRAFARDLRL